MRPRWPTGGGDGRKDGRTEGCTDVWKFPPGSYRTLALWGRCPKKEEGLASQLKMNPPIGQSIQESFIDDDYFFTKSQLTQLCGQPLPDPLHEDGYIG